MKRIERTRVQRRSSTWRDVGILGGLVAALLLLAVLWVRALNLGE
jgi:tetrahydromethanopterin S-methyltransferase subunit G